MIRSGTSRKNPVSDSTCSTTQNSGQPSLARKRDTGNQLHFPAGPEAVALSRARAPCFPRTGWKERGVTAVLLSLVWHLFISHRNDRRPELTPPIMMFSSGFPVIFHSAR